MARKPTRTLQDASGLPAGLVRDLRWLAQYRPKLIVLLEAQVASVMVIERRHKRRWLPNAEVADHD